MFAVDTAYGSDTSAVGKIVLSVKCAKVELFHSTIGGAV